MYKAAQCTTHVLRPKAKASKEKECNACCAAQVDARTQLAIGLRAGIVHRPVWALSPGPQQVSSDAPCAVRCGAHFAIGLWQRAVWPPSRRWSGPQPIAAGRRSTQSLPLTSSILELTSTFLLTSTWTAASQGIRQRRRRRAKTGRTHGDVGRTSHASEKKYPPRGKIAVPFRPGRLRARSGALRVVRGCSSPQGGRGPRSGGYRSAARCRYVSLSSRCHHHSAS